jgi:hypothetical protein
MDKKEILSFEDWTEREGYKQINWLHYKKGNELIEVKDLVSKYRQQENGTLNDC